MAKSLADSGIDTCVIHDSAIFCMMARVNKVILPAHAVLANGGLIAPSGCNMVVLGASQNSVPVVCLTGTLSIYQYNPKLSKLRQSNVVHLFRYVQANTHVPSRGTRYVE